MSTGMQEKSQPQTAALAMRPFCLEIGDCSAPGEMVNRKNRAILLETVRLKLRGRFSFGNQRGRTFGRLAGMPDVPGMFIEVKPEGRRIRIFDPFDFDEKCPGDEDYKGILEDMNAIIKTAAGGVFDVFKPASRPKLDVHQFKTFVRELIRWDGSGNIYKLHVGELPSTESVDKLPGEYMCNEFHSGQVPKFEKEYKAYLENLQRIGAI